MNTYSVLILDDEEFSVDVLMEDIHWKNAAFPRYMACIPSARQRNS